MEAARREAVTGLGSGLRSNTLGEHLHSRPRAQPSLSRHTAPGSPQVFARSNTYSSWCSTKASKCRSNTVLTPF